MSSEKEHLLEKNYLEQFALAARWYLGAQESAEVIADYAEMLTWKEGAPQTPVQRFGTPRQAARLLAEGRNYGQWLAAFAGMGVCAVLLLGRLMDRISFKIGPLWQADETVVTGILLAAGILAALWYFRRAPRTEAAARKVPLALAAVLAVGGMMAVQMAQIWQIIMLIQNAGQAHELEDVVVHFFATMHLAGAVLTAAAFAALAAARCGDRRWRAVYVLALTLLAMLAAMRVITGMLNDIDAFVDSLIEDLLPLALIGLVGTGVALCSKRI